MADLRRRFANPLAELARPFGKSPTRLAIHRRGNELPSRTAFLRADNEDFVNPIATRVGQALRPATCANRALSLSTSSSTSVAAQARFLSDVVIWVMTPALVKRSRAP